MEMEVEVKIPHVFACRTWRYGRPGLDVSLNGGREEGQEGGRYRRYFDRLELGRYGERGGFRLFCFGFVNEVGCLCWRVCVGWK